MEKRNSKKVIDPNRSMDSDGSASVSDNYVTAALMDASRSRGELEIRRILVGRHHHRRSPSASFCLCFQRWIMDHASRRDYSFSGRKAAGRRRDERLAAGARGWAGLVLLSRT